MTCSWAPRRHANRFLAVHGVPRLASALAQDRPRLPAGAVRHAVAACEALCSSCGCAGVEALLGWWRPPQAELEGDGAEVCRLRLWGVGSGLGSGSHRWDHLLRVEVQAWPARMRSVLWERYHEDVGTLHVSV